MEISPPMNTRPLSTTLALVVVFIVASVAAGGRPAAGRRRSLGIPGAPNLLTPEQALAKLQAERDRYWLHAKKEVHRSVLELVAQNQDELERGLKYRKLIQGNPARRWIALTFDDGPHPDYTPKILAILKVNRPTLARGSHSKRH